MPTNNHNPINNIMSDTFLEGADKSFKDQLSQLTDNDIESIVNAAEEAMPEGAVDMREIKNSVQVNPDAELEMDEIDRIAASFENQTGSVSLFDIENGEIPNLVSTTIEKTANNAKDTFDLTDEEVFQMMDTLTNMKDPKYPVFANLPQKVQVVISKLAYDNKVPISALDVIARSMMEEFMNEAGIDSTLIDLEKAIDEALNIPSIMDLYSEHTRDVMENIIPQTIEKIRDEFPDKADKLEQVKYAFKCSYNFSVAKEAYETNARLRKTIRRWETEFKRTLEMFNYLNEKSNFKMNDVNHVPDVLKKVLVEDPNTTVIMYADNNETPPALDMHLVDMDITEEDICKFCILICKHCENMDPNNVIDAAYMYYLVRNIIALRHVQEAKTDFAVELINNICDTITFIRDKESEFNESNMDKSKSTKKSRSNKRNNK